ncbi:MAG: beta-galactosidase [Candidatus Lokiarchaeota archaeon]|nr:beta-galactosidase [Candidatus Lokiarchaeota archaeon]
MTRWVKDIDPQHPLPEYPRPQMKRDDWINLNGIWNYAIRSKNVSEIDKFDGKILVPFPIESALSGVKKQVKGKHKIWYQRKFSIPDRWKGKKILLHFGAVDWETTVFINRKKVGTHQGGYTPFSFDITQYLNQNENELTVIVWDSTNHERGKQSLRPFMIYYTAVSGIWQTIWLEPVPDTFIDQLQMVPNIDDCLLHLKIVASGAIASEKVEIIVKDKNKEIASNSGNLNEYVSLKITDPKIWSPEFPFLYDLDIHLIKNNDIFDKVQSYCGMRKISLGKDEQGHARIELNNEPIFQYGTLDQGYWPDGLYTAPTDEALLYDIEITKEFGFNMIRKHVKVEPLRWYYHCDRLGMLVWQDMPNGGWFIFRKRGSKGKDYFRKELRSMIFALYNSPSIIVWVPFNEGWGQFDTINIINEVQLQDSTRLIDGASGWFDKGVGHIRDIHVYPGPKMPDHLEGRAAVIGEFGGLGLKVDDHLWKSKLKFAYKKYKSSEKLTQKYAEMMQKLKSLIRKGLSAAVYTQITDVEMEINGIITYDRDIIKIDKKQLRKLNLDLFDRIE